MLRGGAAAGHDERGATAARAARVRGAVVRSAGDQRRVAVRWRPLQAAVEEEEAVPPAADAGCRRRARARAAAERAAVGRADEDVVRHVGGGGRRRWCGSTQRLVDRAPLEGYLFPGSSPGSGRRRGRGRACCSPRTASS